MPKLTIPYRSQWDTDAKQNSADCGPTCLAMIMNHYGIEMSPDGVYTHLPAKEPSDFTTFTELANVARAFGLHPDYHNHPDRETAFKALRAQVDAGEPAIALVKYDAWQSVTGNKFQWGHFVVVTGYDDGHVTINDPLFGLWALRSNGHDFTLSNDLFAAGWGGFPATENPNWVAMAIGKAGAPTAEPVPVPVPAPSQPTTPAPRPTPADGGHTMDDEQRRIEALAAYRWAVAPDAGDAAALAIWRAHLGDFGAEYDPYVVQAGDSMSGLAQQYYGQANRWHAIKAYNRLTRDGLWLGETIMVPRLGLTGAVKNDALPSDSAEFAKAIALDDLFDPDLPAQDYNALGANSIGIGFMDTDSSLTG